MGILSSVTRRNVLSSAVAGASIATGGKLLQPKSASAQAAVPPNRELPASEPRGALEPVASFNGAMPTGVTVSHQGRIFVNFPRWGDEVPFTAAEIREGRPVAYPEGAINRADPGDPAAALISVQSVVVDPADRL